METRQLYGAKPVLHQTQSQEEEKRSTPLTPFNDRLRNSEAMLVEFLAENSLPMSMAPKIIDISKALANDERVLGKLCMDRTTASYKLKYGLAATFEESLLEELRKTPLALNMDEAMNSNNQKVVTVLVSHFSSSLQKISVNHLASFVVTRVTSESLFQEMEQLFERCELPWTNLLSVLMDSCRVMRGTKMDLKF